MQVSGHHSVAYGLGGAADDSNRVCGSGENGCAPIQVAGAVATDRHLGVGTQVHHLLGTVGPVAAPAPSLAASDVLVVGVLDCAHRFRMARASEVLAWRGQPPCAGGSGEVGPRGLPISASSAKFAVGPAWSPVVRQAAVWGASHARDRRCAETGSSGAGARIQWTPVRRRGDVVTRRDIATDPWRG